MVPTLPDLDDLGPALAAKADVALRNVQSLATSADDAIEHLEDALWRYADLLPGDADVARLREVCSSGRRIVDALYRRLPGNW